MITIGKVFAIISIVFYSLFVLLGFMKMVTIKDYSFESDLSDILFYIKEDIFFLFESPICLILYSILGIASCIVLLYFGGWAYSVVEYGTQNGKGALIALIIFGFYFSVFSCLGGIFGLIYLGQRKSQHV